MKKFKSDNLSMNDHERGMYELSKKISRKEVSIGELKYSEIALEQLQHMKNVKKGN